MVSPVDQPSEERLLRAATEAGLVKMQTTLPGIVVSYDPIKRTAVVQPAVYAEQPFEPIEDVPVLFPRGGGYRFVVPLTSGDEVELHFVKLDPSRFQITGEPSAANNVRPGGLYATCTPGASSDPKQATNLTIPGAMHLGSEDAITDIVFDASGIRILAGTTVIQLAPAAISLTAGATAIGITPAGMSLGSPLAADFAALASKVDAVLAALAVWAAAHTHTSAAPASPTSPPIAAPPTPTPTGSLSVRVNN